MTVSNVVNGRVGLVREKTRMRVNRAIQQLSYRPHSHARALRLSHGWAIGMLVVTRKSDFVTLQWMGRLSAGLTNILNEHGYGLLLHTQSPEAMDKSILLRRVHTDALIAMLSGPPAQRSAILEKLSRLNQPLIALQETVHVKASRDIAVVRQDDFGGGVLLAEHLAGLGAKKLVFIEPDFAWPAMAERIRGISSVIERVAAASLRVIKCKDAHEHVEEVLLADVRENGLPDAYLAGNELIALAALTTLESTGQRIPDDVLLTGFNAFDLWQFAKRKVTTIHFPAYEMGVRAGELILERLGKGKFSTKLEILPAHLVMGDTTVRI